MLFGFLGTSSCGDRLVPREFPGQFNMIANGAPHTPFSYDLPVERIAQRPVQPPDAARMLVVDKSSGHIEDSTFVDLVEYLHSGDLLIFNDTRVIPARFLGHFVEERRPASQHAETEPKQRAEVEIFLLQEETDSVATSSSAAGPVWLCTGKPLRKFLPGRVVQFAERLRARVLERTSATDVRIQFFDAENTDSPQNLEQVRSLLFGQGLMPIPPYIRHGLSDEQDKVDYQTIFAAQDGSIAAPTASLHFTSDLVARIRDKGVGVSFLTLHVGAASIRSVENSGATVPESERMVVSHDLLERVRETKASGKRVIAVGTTVARALESALLIAESLPGKAHGGPTDLETEADIFITPGFTFRGLDGLITNFHQPGTTHMLLVEALLGRELIRSVYEHALSHDYRFLSYGDGSLFT